MTRSFPAPCRDCGTETLPNDDRRAEWYMVHDAVWEAAGMDRGFLCIGCLESRLGRRLGRADFTGAEVNDLADADNPRYASTYRTDRLKDRLNDTDRLFALTQSETGTLEP